MAHGFPRPSRGSGRITAYSSVTRVWAAAEVDWDRGNVSKCQKHGVSIAEIETLFGSGLLVLPDPASRAKRVLRVNLVESRIAFCASAVGTALGTSAGRSWRSWCDSVATIVSTRLRCSMDGPRSRSVARPAPGGDGPVV